ncbi:TetR/AcrR family transcriptional regulator [Amycolatopsis sp. NPDC088138]|uniref:TetR/AcrR family transcriptional regulator n=1 Tax=Amycolatopsis sp. NPDC088138 TaxID=3363938 RepID=UPI00380A082D
MTTERTITNDARRAQIVKAAIEVLAESGYPGATFTRITQHAGLRSPRMISYHFADKAELIQQVAVEVISAGARAILARIEHETAAVPRLRGYLEANLRFLWEHPREIAALSAVGPYLRKPEGTHYTSQSAREFSVLNLEGMLADGQRTGEFRSFDLRAVAVMIRGAIDAAADQFHGDPPLDLDAYTRTVVDTFTRAVTAEEPT